jgi:hypothetical protein
VQRCAVCVQGPCLLLHTDTVGARHLCVCIARHTFHTSYFMCLAVQPAHGPHCLGFDAVPFEQNPFFVDHNGTMITRWHCGDLLHHSCCGTTCCHYLAPRDPSWLPAASMRKKEGRSVCVTAVCISASTALMHECYGCRWCVSALTRACLLLCYTCTSKASASTLCIASTRI